MSHQLRWNSPVTPFLPEPFPSPKGKLFAVCANNSWHYDQWIPVAAASSGIRWSPVPGPGRAGWGRTRRTPGTRPWWRPRPLTGHRLGALLWQHRDGGDPIPPSHWVFLLSVSVKPRPGVSMRGSGTRPACGGAQRGIPPSAVHRISQRPHRSLLPARPSPALRFVPAAWACC